MLKLKSISHEKSTYRVRQLTVQIERKSIMRTSRRASLIPLQQDVNMQSQRLPPLRRYQDCAPKLKIGLLIECHQELVLIGRHFRMFMNQNHKANNWATFANQQWTYYLEDGDLHDHFTTLLSFHNKLSGLREFTELCIFEKLIISICSEYHQEEFFKRLFELFIETYEYFLQNLPDILGKECRQAKQISEIIHINSNSQPKNKLSDLISDLSELAKQQKSHTLWQLFRRIKVTQAYALNVRLLRRILAQWLNESKNSLGQPFPQAMMTAQKPYLPINILKPILAIDLDETLLHYNPTTNDLAIRPYALEFLEQLHEYYCIVIWTASLPRYARWALSKLNPQIHKSVDYLLTREFCVSQESGGYLKQLANLGPHIQNCLLIENDVRSVHPTEVENAIIVDHYLGQEDQVLQTIMLQLIEAFSDISQGTSLVRAYRKQIKN